MKPRDWILLFSPLGLVLGILLSWMVRVLILKNDMLYFSISNQMVQMISIGIVLAIWFIFVFGNIYEYFIEGRRDFSLSEKSSISKDKRTIMYPNVPRKYLSKQPDDFTIGRYRNKYFRIPIDTNDVKHTLIIGSPGSFKSSTLLNALIWNFNFEKENRPMTAFALDVKPELSRKSIDESRTDVKIIDPSVNTGCGFNVWYGLDQDSLDDQLIERADLIARTLITNPSGNGDNEFFYISAQNLMVPFLVYGFRKGMGFVETILQIIRIPLQDLITTVLMDEDMQTNHPKVIGMLTPYDGKDSDAIQDIELTLRQDLRIFDTDTVKYQFDDNPLKASPQDLINGISIFLALPDHLLKQYSPVFRLITQMVLN